MKRCQKMSTNKRLWLRKLECSGTLPEWLREATHQDRAYAFFLLFFSPEKIHPFGEFRWHLFFGMCGKLPILQLCKKYVFSGKCLMNLAFANRKDLMLQQLCRKSDVLSFSCRIVSVSTIAFFSSLSVTFSANLILDVFPHYSVLWWFPQL